MGVEGMKCGCLAALESNCIISGPQTVGTVS